MRTFIHELDGHDLLIVAGFTLLNTGLVLLFSVGLALTVSGVLILSVAGWRMR